MSETEGIPSGGAKTGLDLSSEKDRGLVRQAVKNWPKRWAGLTDDFKDELAKQLRDAGKAMHDALPVVVDIDKRCRISSEIASIVRTAVTMEAQNQADEHKHEAYERVDQGKGTELVKHDGVCVVVPGLPKTE